MTFARHLTPVFALTAVLGVAACSEPAPEIAAEGGDVVECALDGSGTFAPDCRLLELPATQGSAWMIRHPDGGFHRVERDAASGAYVTGDGAIKAEFVTEGGYNMLTIDDDRYRWALDASGG